MEVAKTGMTVYDYIKGSAGAVSGREAEKIDNCLEQLRNVE